MSFPIEHSTLDIDAPNSVAASHPASLRVVAIGGGTGLSTILRGFRRFVASPLANGAAVEEAASVLAPQIPC